MVKDQQNSLTTGSLGTFNPGPTIVVKQKLAEQPDQGAQPPTSEQATADGQPSDPPHQDRAEKENVP